jgi:membrane protein implicated in regulation of membrane protease activity
MYLGAASRHGHAVSGQGWVDAYTGILISLGDIQMEFSAATFWWVAAGVLVAAELATGSFYLLMLAGGLVAGAIAAHIGLGVTAQIVVAAMAGGGATALWHVKRAKEPRSLPARENRDVNLDIGEQVHVAAWADDGTARVQYRGAGWTARLAPGTQAQPGPHVVSAVEGNWLVLSPLPAARPDSSTTH